jgi:uncharacterized LabA/DUF88 family protein
MVKGMLFVDGSWFYRTFPRMRTAYGDDTFRIDYGRLPQALREHVGQSLAMEVDLVRVHWFASIPHNFDPADQESFVAQQRFYDALTERFHYEVRLFNIDFKGHRLRFADRAAAASECEDSQVWKPQEKCVDIALATSLLYYAAIPGAYDVAIALVGDRDYIPVLQQVRLLGKRVQVVGIRGHTARDFSLEGDPERIRDFDTIFLDDILDQIRLREERKAYRCNGCSQTFYTTYRPQRPDERLYCDRCRANHKATLTARYGSDVEHREALT